MNFLQLKTRVAATLGLARSASQDAEEWQLIGDTINEAVVDILTRTRVYIKCVDITLDANEREYELDDSILKLYNLTKGTTELQEYAPGDLGRGLPGYSIPGHNRLRIGWDPEQGDVIEAWYTPRPTPMTNDAHDPSEAPFGIVPAQFHKAIIDYACWHLADAAGDAGSARGERYRISYEGQDGMGGMGSDLGQIKLAVNQRARSGSRSARIPRSGELLIGDTDPTFWQG